MAGGTQAHVRANRAYITDTALLRSFVELHTVSEGIGDDDSHHSRSGSTGERGGQKAIEAGAASVRERDRLCEQVEQSRRASSSRLR